MDVEKIMDVSYKRNWSGWAEKGGGKWRGGSVCGGSIEYVSRDKN